MQPPPGPPPPRPPRHELRLEAAWRRCEQMSRLRRQDVGLKTHLDQLDQQISELQLDVRRSSSEAPDSDSRPSSGFYELSDGGSCSLSTSCTSVCSDRLSSSLGTLLPATAKAGPSTGDCRPRSADETTVCGVPLPTWGSQASEEGESRPRPVSTGDLERALPAEVRLQKASAHPKATSLLCHGVDPKFQRDLVSKGGREVYPARPQLPRQDAQARSESGGSEPTSPFHSTIAETSEDEASDHTANRFGDAESGSSDSEGCVQGGGRGPAWAGAAPQLPPRAPAGSRPPLPPVPRLCRIKASKALKKRIRRFQPAALKVMTLV
ncbi:Dapper-like protein 2 [Camelus dromedarius]|uniref:Dapper-like protein 2 n=1 Tax=Camelus dromedarius TaxID=9838 RepID=A0A5N4DX66_CAMDR|nr:Dapper-like protein 2 [Camelus dromedarius]